MNRLFLKYISIASYVLAVLVLCSSCRQSYVEEWSTPYTTIRLNGEGFISQIIDKKTGTNYITESISSPLLTLYDGKDYVLPEQMEVTGNELKIKFANQSEATLSKEIKGDYIRLTLLSLTNREGIEAVAWGPYATTLSQYIGETIGVVRDSVFAIGVQALNLYTTEGLPHLGDDASGGTYIDPLPGQTIPDELKDKIGTKIDFINVNVEGDMPEYVRNWRGNAAEKRPYGSNLQFFARDWRKPRTIDIYGRKQQVEAVEQDYINSSIALFAASSDKVLEIIGKIEQGEGLPHPMADGVWIKQRKLPNPAYMLYDGRDLDRGLDYADSCNFHLLHIGDIFKSWGHFELNTSRFPQGATQIKAFTDKARKRGIEIGVHTLTMFTSQHDAYVTPIPSDSLCVAGSCALSKEVNATDREIFINDPTFFSYTGPTHTVKIGKELIAYKEVSKEKPYRLTGCTRGQFGTKPVAHACGEQVEKLVNDDYSGFFPNIYLQDQYADRLAEVCKETGIGLMDFDGYGGGSPTGHGCFGAGRFVDHWYKNLDKYYITCGAGTFHYYWHIYSFMNWGEPWYDNLRESQVNYRMENQRYFERNLMPGMLGWFKLEPTYRPEDVEWIQARSAAFDAGYLLRVDESIEQNGFKSHLFEAVREWQKVRNQHLLTPAQRERMKNPKNEFHLEKVNEKTWNLYDVTLQGGNIHKFRLVQAGEPLLGKFVFTNPYDKQPVQFYGKVLPGDEVNGKLSQLLLTIEGNAPIRISADLKAGNKLYCNGQNVYVCDEHWNILSAHPLSNVIEWNKGENKITAQCEFSSAKAPSIELEFKVLGNKEKITKK